MKLSGKINNFSTDLTDVRQKFAGGNGFVIVVVKIEKKIVFFSYEMGRLINI